MPKLCDCIVSATDANRLTAALVTLERIGDDYEKSIATEMVNKIAETPTCSDVRAGRELARESISQPLVPHYKAERAMAQTVRSREKPRGTLSFSQYIFKRDLGKEKQVHGNVAGHA
jgi:hypothetical protein